MSLTVTNFECYRWSLHEHVYLLAHKSYNFIFITWKLWALSTTNARQLPWAAAVSQKILLGFVIIYSRPHIIIAQMKLKSRFHKSIKFPFNDSNLFPVSSIVQVSRFCNWLAIFKVIFRIFSCLECVLKKLDQSQVKVKTGFEQPGNVLIIAEPERF